MSNRTATIDQHALAAPPRNSPPADATAAYVTTSELSVAELSAAVQTVDEFTASALTSAGEAGDVAWPLGHPRYKVLGEIASGGMGLVLRVHDADFDRTLAVKVLLEGQRGSEAHERLLDEARITGRLQHPGIPPAHEVGRLADGRPYFSMKLIEGRTLAALLAERTSPRHDLPRFLKVFEQVAQTLAYAHAQGVIHRDVKPLNIMVGAFGEVQVMDWGLAKRIVAKARAAEAPATVCAAAVAGPSNAVVETAGVDLDATDLAVADGRTRHGAVLGTLAFMAPEQARGEVERLDARCDVFGLGALLCAILTGEPPYRQRGMAEVWRAAREADLADAWSRLDDCGADDELVRLAKTCLSPSSDQRLDDAGQVAARVADYLASVRERLEQARVAQAQAEVQAGEERKRRRLAVLLAASVVALVAGGAAFGLWYANDLAHREQDRIRAEAEITSRRDYLTHEVSAALREADNLRDRLQLNDPRQASLFLSELEQWRTLLADAAAALKRAETLAAGDRDLLPADVSNEMIVLSQDIARDEAQRRLAVKLDRIRFEASSPVAGGDIQIWRAAPKLSQAFREAGFDFQNAPPEQIAERLRASDIRLPLVAALDFWALVTRDGQLRRLVLSLARRADPDPWRDRVRDPESWRDRDQLEALISDVDFARQSPQLLASVAMRLRLVGGDAPAFVRRALAHHPRDFWLFFELGHASQDPVEQIGAFRAALAVRPQSAYAHYGLGVVHYGQGQLELALASYQRAIELSPDSPGAFNNLGLVLQELNRPEEALAAYHKAIEIDPENAPANVNLAGALQSVGRLDEALSYATAAVELDPNYAAGHVNRGAVLRMMNRMPEAIASFEAAVKVSSNNPWAWCNLGHARTQLGDFGGGLDALRRGHDLGSREKRWTAPSEQWVRDAELRIDMDARLPAILAGEPPPEGGSERLMLANLCLMHHKRFAAAVKFFGLAFAADKQFAEDSTNDNRYNAACGAALAAAGQGLDGASLTAEERATLRIQALAWLTSELAAWQRKLEQQPGDAPAIAHSLAHWLADPDLSSLRDATSLSRLPEAERAEWETLWQAVAALRDKAAMPET